MPVNVVKYSENTRSTRIQNITVIVLSNNETILESKEKINLQYDIMQYVVGVPASSLSQLSGRDLNYTFRGRGSVFESVDQLFLL